MSLTGMLAIATFGLTTLVNADSYTVKSGDTLSTIAKNNNTTVDAIAQKNNISNVNVISVGQVLELDTAVSTTPAVEVTKTTESTTVSSTSGLSAEDAEAKEWIAQKESSGSYTAQNGQYYGRYQLTITYLNGDLSPENQEKVADNYVTSRYGSWTAAKNFWLANGWY
ncbi:LysM peptidoglycan-binding domain-containing protein [Streptococcus sp. DD10]|uniref:aggregation-promoting factor n=1 Tax=Streptococcus sp. DD10 TaxID=1777878 RepID=UPI0012E77488|nr:LysM peptidoglycan-binding domain-containing protein [Streptococcus sp. DD10]